MKSAICTFWFSKYIQWWSYRANSEQVKMYNLFLQIWTWIQNDPNTFKWIVSCQISWDQSSSCDYSFLVAGGRQRSDDESVISPVFKLAELTDFFVLTGAVSQCWTLTAARPPCAQQHPLGVDCWSWTWEESTTEQLPLMTCKVTVHCPGCLLQSSFSVYILFL